MRRDRSEGAGFVGVLGRPAVGGAFADVIRVIVSAAESDREVSDDERERIESVRVGSVRARRSSDAFSGTSVDWFQNGRSVLLIGPRDKGDVVLDVARRVRLDGATAAETRVEGTPAGYVAIGSWRISGFASDTAGLSATDPRGIAFDLMVQVVPAESSSLAAFTIGTELRPVRVRGREGFLATDVSRVRDLEITSRSVAWFEADGVMVRASGTQMPEPDLLRLVESLESVSEAEFLAFGEAR
ncbi:MAG TPA: hypothetical protein VMY34_11560 [Acidimicrobiales bacterium]|nr:hypothetical protein [Acidimicrobiales bacterium]